VAIGDVCGKGPAAAALTAMVRYAIRDAAVTERSPARVLAALNAELLARDEGDLVTAIFATVDIDEGEPCVTLAVGGHPLALLAHADGTVERVGRPGTLLGAVDSAVSRDSELRLGQGDLLLVYTDGVTEAPTAHGRFGEPRLAELLGSCAAMHPQQVVERIDEEVRRVRLEAGDDVALLAVRPAIIR
jgi:serine phosphatase RsbU (regulator of sigma subunit)